MIDLTHGVLSWELSRAKAERQISRLMALLTLAPLPTPPSPPKQPLSLSLWFCFVFLLLLVRSFVSDSGQEASKRTVLPPKRNIFPVPQKWSIYALFSSTGRAIQHAAWGNINKYSQWEGNRWDEEIEPADFWTVFNEWSFIILKQNCSLIFVNIRRQKTPLRGLLPPPPA